MAELDAEHEVCAQALAAFAKFRDFDALEAVLDAYEAHFAHEETLLDTHLYPEVAAGGGDGFSANAGARKSHYADHARLLDDIRKQLATGKPEISALFASKVLRDFENHANVYDAMYTDPLAERLRN